MSRSKSRTVPDEGMQRRVAFQNGRSIPNGLADDTNIGLVTYASNSLFGAPPRCSDVESACMLVVRCREKRIVKSDIAAVLDFR